MLTSVSAIIAYCFYDFLKKYEKSADVWTLLPVASNGLLNGDSKLECEILVAKFPVITKMHDSGV